MLMSIRLGRGNPGFVLAMAYPCAVWVGFKPCHVNTNPAHPPTLPHPCRTLNRYLVWIGALLLSWFVGSLLWKGGTPFVCMYKLSGAMEKKCDACYRFSNPLLPFLSPSLHFPVILFFVPVFFSSHSIPLFLLVSLSTSALPLWNFLWHTIFMRSSCGTHSDAYLSFGVG